ncbi:MAG: SDR family oxidoreductase [Deltaproteobacteria bacterium]|jgi:NAD(P)-dependent dehydrogenase (short-subunit alcohol dehydrogenase family)|nr:SDR family oxidoreductase [Deltaproteobacteria bacterium]MBW2495639.1 SDR family oxidoreductase [Deltaproteobacteria bacterium]
MAKGTIPSGGLEGMAVLVTGGGTGIGMACAARLAADGAAVTICGRTESKLEDAVKKIESVAGHGGSVQLLTGDVTNEDDVQRIVAKAAEPTGALDGCIANAGGGGGMGPYHLQDTQEFLRVLHLNVLGTMLCVKHSTPYMVEAGGGSFVGMSSIAGHVTHPYFGAYCVGKAGLEEMMKNAADEYGPRGVRFNSIRPGFIATEIMENIPQESEVYISYIENTPMGDVGQPEDVAHLARFLIGPESRWVTGTAINVDGGHALRRGPNFRQFVEPAFGADVLSGDRPKG